MKKVQERIDEKTTEIYVGSTGGVVEYDPYKLKFEAIFEMLDELAERCDKMDVNDIEYEMNTFNKGVLVDCAGLMEEPMSITIDGVKHLVTKQPNRTQRVNDGEMYYFVSDSGDVGSWKELGNHSDDFRHFTSNYYHTHEEAEEALKNLTK